MIKMNLSGRQFFKKIGINKIYLWNIFVITIVFVVVWIGNQIFPFEEHSLILADGVHQYIPFFSEYYEKIKNGESLLYSFHVGMGNNFFSLFSYYLSGPLNLFVLFFPKDKLYFSLSLLVYIKILLSGLSFAYYLIHRPTEYENEEKETLIENRKKEFYIAGFSIAYALSSYCVGYYWNIMWLDCIYIFPLVVLGMERLVKEKKILLYVVTLSYCMYCNYYMAFMVCIFLILYFFTFKSSSVKVFMMNGFRFAVSSLLAGGISAFMLLPAYWGIKTTSAGGTMTSGIPVWEWYGHLKETLVSQLALNTPVTVDVAPWKANLYCSILILFLLPMFLWKRNGTLYRKLTIIASVFVFYVSYDNELLNYIWHGFHAQNGIPNRMVFLCNFLLLVIGYEVLKDRETIPWYGFGFGLLASFGFVLYLWKVNPEMDIMVFSTSFLLIVLYALLFAVEKWGKLSSKMFSRAITVILSAEVALMALIGMIENGFSDAQQKFGLNENLKEAKVWLKEEVKDDLYRTEFSIVSYMDESTYHNLNSISAFCSTVDADVVSTLGSIGFYADTNTYMHQGATQFTDSILGVRYIIKKDILLTGFISDDEGMYNTIRNEGYQINTFPVVKEFGSVQIFENQAPLTLGFEVSTDIDTFRKSTGSVFEVQNQLAQKMTGERTQLFEMVNGESSVESTSNITITKQGEVAYSFEKTNLEEAYVKVQIPIEEDMDLYLFPDGRAVDIVMIWLDSELCVVEKEFPKQIYDIGPVKEGQILTVKYKIREDGMGKGTLAVYMAKYNEENFKKHYEVLSKNQLSVKQLDANILECTSKDKDGGLYFTSIPYDDGFEITVDGKKQDAKILADAFLGFELEPLKEGQKEHKIVIKFVPVGLKEGIIISISSACIFILILCLQRVWNKKKEEHVSGSDMGISDEVSS